MASGEIQASARSKKSSDMSCQITTMLIVVVLQLVAMSDLCQGSSPNFDADTQIQTSTLSFQGVSNPNCTKTYKAVNDETCTSMRESQNISQAQLQQLNPWLNCKTLRAGERVCVQGIPADCRRTITVEAGPATNSSLSSCQSIADSQGLTLEGFFILNPGISCPENSSKGSNQSWPSSRVVCVAPGLGNIFVEYIGATGRQITFDDVQPLVQTYSQAVVFHLVLAFAIDADKNGIPQNGIFTPYWTSSLNPESAKAFRKAYPGARILMSLGGASQYINSTLTVNVVWEDPPNPNEWIANAQASLTAIAQDYSIDGIDIDYEMFPTSSNFSYCIGTLIKQLKGNKTIGLATIAPFGDVIPEYLTLMQVFGDLIDYVNFQFYAYDLPTVDNYIQQYNTTAFQFVPWKLLASTSVVQGSTAINGRPFQETMLQLGHQRGLVGVMLWDADDSLSSNFTQEKGVLDLLSGSSTNLSPTPSPSPSQPIAPGGLPPNGGLAPAPSPSSAPAGLLGGRRSSSQWFGLLSTAIFTVVLSQCGP